MLAKIRKKIKKVSHLTSQKKKYIKSVSFDYCTAPVSHIFGCERGTPIDRYYIENFISTNKSLIHGVCCEIAEDTYCKKYGTAIIRQEILHYNNTNPAATIIGDLTKHDSLPQNLLDCFICTQTFNFIYDVKSAFQGTYKMLKPGGALIATVAGISQISRYDMDRWGDYWRFTDLSLKKMAEETGFHNITINVYGNALAATSFVQGIAVEDLKNPKLLDELDIDYQVTLGLLAYK